jgi:hypothetical protein
MQRSPAGIHSSKVGDDHLIGEHRFHLVPGADAVQQRKDKACRHSVERLDGIGMKNVEDVAKERLSDAVLGCPKRGEKADSEIFRVLCFIEDRLDLVAALRLREPDARRWQ